MKATNQIPALCGKQFHSRYFTDVTTGYFPADKNFILANRSGLHGHIASHRLEGYMMQLVTGGEGTLVLGSRQHYVNKNMLIFMGPNAINAWQAHDEQAAGYVCAFAETFFTADRANKRYLADLPFFQLDQNQVICLTTEQARDFENLFAMMQAECAAQSPTADVIRGYLQVVLAKALVLYAAANATTGEPSTGLRIVKAFMEAYMGDIATIRGGEEIRVKKIAAYAAELGISQNHLNDTVKAVTGKSAGQLIREQLLRQATMCLKHSSKSIKEIAHLVGFEDPSYFARFYKKQTGKLPSEFRVP